MASPAKRCLYEVLGVDRECTADEIRSAYKRLALQRHPDKLVKSGVPEAEATTAFQELVNAYEVLSDPRERSWYDSNRNQIMFSSNSAATGSSSPVPDLFPFFSNSVYTGYSDSGRGFYKVYGDLFEKIYANELSSAKRFGFPFPREAPVIGNLESLYVQVTAFYNYWLGFATVLDFFWVDEVGDMPNRKYRRLLEEHNKKLRKNEKKKYNDIVRQLAEFVKKRDKRVRDMQMKKNEESKIKREQEKQRMKELERQKAEKARHYVEPDWAKVEEVEVEDDVEDELGDTKREFYCVICNKKFKSDKQWKNHEQSKKHKEKVAELREAFSEEDKDFEVIEGNESEAEEDKDFEVMEGNESEAEEDKEHDGDAVNYLSADDMLNNLKDQFKDGVRIREDVSDYTKTELTDANESTESDSYGGEDGAPTNLGMEDDESSVLEAMLSGRKNRKKLWNQPQAPSRKLQIEIDDEELEFMEYNNTKSNRRNKGRRRRRGGPEEEQTERGEADMADQNADVKENREQDEDVESTSHHSPGCEDSSQVDDLAEMGQKHRPKAVKKSVKKKGNPPKSTTASKERKQKVGANSSDNICEKCGEEFDSRNRLHKHLGDTGHASLKSR